ncbi:MAG: ribonucleoside triphosphate reductase [Puniceicoccales bacterium]|jgi:ribonucleoside-triphosphate reductase|nr:ribonucleoside triphosphate reductase [Puniceicoccales bacterium]
MKAPFSLPSHRDAQFICSEEQLLAQVHGIFVACGKLTGEFDSAAAWNLARAVISELWQRGKAEFAPVEEVEKLIESVLLKSPHVATAKAFILRAERAAGERKVVIDSDISRIKEYISRADWQVKENSNMTYSLQGLNHYLAGALSQSYWLHEVYDGRIREAHESGDFHIHDLSLISVYCVGWDLADLLRKGFCGVPGKLEALPPRHFRTALGQVVNFFYTLQGEAAGAQAFSNFDTLLAPFIAQDRLDFTAVKQSLQEFLFNVNVPTRVGFQTPFTNITLDLFCPKHLKDEPTIVGGEFQRSTYGQFQREMDLFNRALFEVMAEGDARGRVLTFPIPTINITKDFEWDNPNLEGLWEMTGKYGIPYFSNFVNSDMKPEDTRSMCCRLRIDNTQLVKRGGGLFGANPLTGSIGVVTLNLPRLAYLSKNEGDFRERLAALMDLARESLEIKRNFLERLTATNLYPYTSFYLSAIRERMGCYWKNHFSTIGLVGMNEACTNLLGEGIVGKIGKAFALRTLDFMRGRILDYQKETGNHYNLEATPAEGTSFRLAKKDRAKFKEISTADGIGGDAPFYTNSIHVPVNAFDDIFAVLEHQDELQTKFTGGTVVHLFLGERITDTSTVKNLARTITDNYRLPYFSLTPTFSVCPVHGYLSGEHPTCPDCGSATEVYSRIVGYLRPVQQWNDGKQCEFKLRKSLGYGNFSGASRPTEVAVGA